MCPWVGGTWCWQPHERIWDTRFPPESSREPQLSGLLLWGSWVWPPVSPESRDPGGSTGLGAGGTHATRCHLPPPLLHHLRTRRWHGSVSFQLHMLDGHFSPVPTMVTDPGWYPAPPFLLDSLHACPVSCSNAYNLESPQQGPPRPWWQRSGCPESEQLSGDANMNSNIGTRDPDLKVNVHEKFLGICLVRHTTPHTVSGWALVFLPSSSECPQHLSPCEYRRRPHEALPGGELEDSSPYCVIDVQPSRQPRHLHPCHQWPHSVLSNSLQPHGL